MRKTGKFLISITILNVLLKNIAFAATDAVEESQGGLSIKYVFIGVAALVILLLLFLGYKMDTKEDSTPHVSHKAEKVKKKLTEKAEEIQQNEGNYEADKEAYQADEDVFENEDFNSPVEYHDDEDSLYAMSNDDDEYDYEDEDENTDDTEYKDDFNGGFGYEESEPDEMQEEPEEIEENPEELEESEEMLEENPEEPEEETEEEENTGFFSRRETPVVVDAEEPETEEEMNDDLEDEGEEFDTSIIDGLEDEEEDASSSSFDDTMMFNNSDFTKNGNDLEDEIDSLDNLDDEFTAKSESEEDDNSFIEKLKSYEEPESTFEGFSVAPRGAKAKKEEPEEKEDAIEEEQEEEPMDEFENEPLNDTLEETIEELDPISNTSSVMDNDFLSQMEENLKKSKEERTAKKGKKTIKTTKKFDE